MENREFPHDDLDDIGMQLQRQRLLAMMFNVGGEPVRLEHYEVERELGRGAMGVVYVARDTKLDRRVAIKRLQARGDVELRQRLVREAQALAKLAHPNVVPIHEIGEDQNGAFIVMEYVEGSTLLHWLNQVPRSIPAIIDVFVAAGRGLAAAHDKNLVHRDFKPDNVMVGADGRVRVMDFGLARVEPLPEMTASSEIGLSSTNEVMTRAGALIGTPAYMAPEQLSGQRADAASDQFCFCVALHEALYGQRPFHAATLAELRAEIDAQRITGTNAKVPGWLRELIVRGLKPAPTQRHASMRTLLDAIEAGAREAGLSARQPPAYVFMAHAGVDKPAALRLCVGLLDHGVRPWIDLWDVPPSADAGPLVAAALRDAPAVLLCCGRAGQQLQREYGAVLQARIDADPETVYRATLPAGSDAGLPSMPGVSLDGARWFEGVAELARLVGVDRQRTGWLLDEALRVGLVEQQLSPYLGPRSYGEADARWMFGRERETGELLELVRADAARWLTVLGASGSGKSSLVAAGVCPAIRHGAVGGRVWQLGHLRPGVRPCESLADALVNLRGPSGDPVVDALKVAQLRDQLLDDAGALKLVIDRIVSAAAGPMGRVVLVVDQLEQLFTVAGLTGEPTHAEALSFVRNLRAATGPGSPLWVIATLDRDFMPRCLEVPDLAQVLESGVYFGLLPIDKAQVRDAIVRPARRVGFEVERELIDRLVDVATEPGVRLQLLQQQLRELWAWRDETRRVLPISAYDQVHTVASSRAATSAASQPPPVADTHLDLQAARRAFRQRRDVETPRDEIDPDVVCVAKGLRKVYATHAFTLQDVDLVLRRGQIVGLVGANGSGKTTLLRIVAGEIDIDGGAITYRSLAERGEWRKIRAGISHVQQQPPRWYGPLQDTLRYEAAQFGLRGKKNDEEVEFMLHRLGLERYANSAWSEISVGFQTRFELARALMKRPQLLVLDEPLAALDVLTQQLYLQDLREIASSSLGEPPAVLISSQHLHEVESIADEVLALRRGKPMFAGKLRQLREDRVENSFELAFDGEAWAARGAIARFGPDARLVRVGMNYVLSVPRDVTLDQVVRALAEGALGLTFIRDISGSTRRLFEAEKD